MKTTHNAHRRHGFTLVELLVVIGIIAVLIGILLPALNKARAQAKSVACLANLRSLGQAIQIYAVDNKGVLPVGYWQGQTPTATASDNSKATHWILLLQATMAKGVGTTFNDAYSSGSNNSKVREAFICPEAPGDKTTDNATSAVTSYLCHPRLMPWFNPGGGYPQDNYPNGSANGPMVGYKISRIKRGAEKPLIFDGSLEAKAVPSGVAYHPSGDIPVAFRLDGYGMSNSPFLTDARPPGVAAIPSYNDPTKLLNVDTGVDTNQDTPGNGNNIRFRHLKNTVCNALMVDGHCEGFHFKDKNNLDLHKYNVNVTPPR